MKTKEITEGETRLLVPSEGKITKKDIVFYNPEMKLNRDVSVYIAEVVKPDRFCDLLAGTGARGVRIANEAGIKYVLINDRNPEAVKLIERNAKLNGVSVDVSGRDAASLLEGESFDFIDVDPFGPPVAFIDSAVRALENKGILAVTATDTSALCGTYPRACRRKYDSSSLRTEYYNELGIRILLGYVIRYGLRYNVAFQPLFSHCTRHYFRVYLRAERGSGKSNKALEDIVFLQHCFSCLNRKYSDLNSLEERCGCGNRFNNAGPLWSNCFSDVKFCSKLLKKVDSDRADILRLVDTIKEEQKIVNPYFNIHKIFHKLKMPAKTTKDFFNILESNGFLVCKTHFSALGMRTNANISQINELI